MQREVQIRKSGHAGWIAHALTRGMGWGSREPPKPADEVWWRKASAERWKLPALAVEQLTPCHIVR